MWLDLDLQCKLIWGAACSAVVPHLTHPLALAARQLHPPAARACPREKTVKTPLQHSSTASPDRSLLCASRVACVPDLYLCGRICPAARAQLVLRCCSNVFLVRQRSSDGQIGAVQEKRSGSTVTTAQPRDAGPAAAYGIQQHIAAAPAAFGGILLCYFLDP